MIKVQFVVRPCHVKLCIVKENGGSVRRKRTACTSVEKKNPSLHILFVNGFGTVCSGYAPLT